MKEQLRQAGLTENESELYIALLNAGPSRAGELARKTGLHRRVVYDLLAKLEQKGLVGSIAKNHTRFFQPTDPRSIVELLEQKQKNIEDIMPQLEELYNKTKEIEGANFFTGRAGLKAVMEDQIATGENIHILGASPLAYDILQFYFKWFDRRRVKEKIKVKILFSATKNAPKVPLSEIRYLPEKYSSPLAVNIYGDKVAIILWSKENPLAIVIKNREISEGYKKYFDLMWKAGGK